MEQEVPVTIHSRMHKDPAEAPTQDTAIPKQVSALGETISDAFLCFRESESFSQLINSADKVREYIKKNPAQALLISLGAGALFGLLIKRKR